MAQVGNDLVAADVQGADRHRAVGRRFDDLPVRGELLLFIGNGGVREKQIFGAIQADAGRAGANGRLGVGGAVDVGEQLHAGAVSGDRFQVAVLNEFVAQVDIFALQLA